MNMNFPAAKVQQISKLAIINIVFFSNFAWRMATNNPYLDVQHLSKRIGDLVLFDNISFSVAEGQRIGLIAQNGTGKSTLMNIICGDEDYDDGQIVYRRGLKVGYLEQSPAYPTELTVLEACFWHGNETTDLIRRYERALNVPGTPELADLMEEMDSLGAWDYEQRAKQILSKLHITDFEQPIGQLSGGQLKRVALANVLLTDPDLLVLDEPTNHLDLEMIEWLENYLIHNVRSLLLVTHDRYFLDRVCSYILELSDHTLYSYQGSYSYYLEKREERVRATNAAIARANNLYRRELDWMRRMPCARGHKARYRQDAFSELEKEAKRRIEERTARLEIKSGYIGSKIFEAEYVSKSFGPDTVILDNFYYNFSRFEKMGIVGKNGSGKSTFVKMLLGEIKPDQGRFVVGETVRFGYFSQEGMTFNNEMKVIDVVRDIAETIDLGGGRKLTASQFLQHFLFPPDRQQNYVYKLSGGERRRLYLCTVLMRNPNFLVLDEPTNDLDIATLQVLEEYLADFRGCAIIVSHDRYFMDKIVDHLLVFRGNGDVFDFPGNYSQYREWEALRIQEKETQREKETRKHSQNAKPASERRTKSERRKLSFNEKREMEALETEIDALETEKGEIESALCCGTLQVDELTRLSKRLPQIQEELDEKTMRWLELSEIGQ